VRLPRREFGPSLDLLVVGLGNPGPEYAATRHNVGFMVTDRLAEGWSASWRSKFSGRVCEARDGDLRLALLQPQTYMNLSGRSVAAALRFYKLDPAALVAVHDEIDLPLGDVRAKLGGGLAGHNGLRSLRDSLGTADFARVRIGVGRPERGERLPVAEWVLRRFPPEVDVDALVGRGAECTLAVVRDGVDAAMRAWNGPGPPLDPEAGPQATG
jgi:peptidyl-tRNA hydrolase, PTH1 family